MAYSRLLFFFIFVLACKNERSIFERKGFKSFPIRGEVIDLWCSEDKVAAETKDIIKVFFNGDIFEIPKSSPKYQAKIEGEYLFFSDDVSLQIFDFKKRGFKYFKGNLLDVKCQEERCKVFVYDYKDFKLKIADIEQEDSYSNGITVSERPVCGSFVGTYFYVLLRDGRVLFPSGATHFNYVWTSDTFCAPGGIFFRMNDRIIFFDIESNKIITITKLAPIFSFPSIRITGIKSAVLPYASALKEVSVVVKGELIEIFSNQPEIQTCYFDYYTAGKDCFAIKAGENVYFKKTQQKGVECYFNQAISTSVGSKVFDVKYFDEKIYAASEMGLLAFSGEWRRIYKNVAFFEPTEKGVLVRDEDEKKVFLLPNKLLDDEDSGYALSSDGKNFFWLKGKKDSEYAVVLNGNPVTYIDLGSSNPYSFVGAIKGNKWAMTNFTNTVYLGVGAKWVKHNVVAQFAQPIDDGFLVFSEGSLKKFDGERVETISEFENQSLFRDVMIENDRIFAIDWGFYPGYLRIFTRGPIEIFRFGFFNILRLVPCKDGKCLLAVVEDRVFLFPIVK